MMSRRSLLLRGALLAALALAHVLEGRWLVAHSATAVLLSGGVDGHGVALAASLSFVLLRLFLILIAPALVVRRAALLLLDLRRRPR